VIREPLGTGFGQNFDMMGVIVIQKRVAYFGCTAVLDGSSAARVRAGQPFFSSPASLVRPHLLHGMAGVAGWHRSLGRWTQKRIAHHFHRSR